MLNMMAENADVLEQLETVLESNQNNKRILLQMDVSKEEINMVYNLAEAF